MKYKTTKTITITSKSFNTESDYISVCLLKILTRTQDTGTISVNSQGRRK